MIEAGTNCRLIRHVHQERDAFSSTRANFDSLNVRCNPGQIKADGGDQGKFDDGARGMRELGRQARPSADAMALAGAKDAPRKAAIVNIGLEGAPSFYGPAGFAAGVDETTAFQPRVSEPNQGSSGMGAWIIELKRGDYCPAHGERVYADDAAPDFMETRDNHAEEHAATEFAEFASMAALTKSGLDRF